MRSIAWATICPSWNGQLTFCTCGRPVTNPVTCEYACNGISQAFRSRACGRLPPRGASTVDAAASLALRLESGWLAARSGVLSPAQAPRQHDTEPGDAMAECRVRLRAHLIGHVGSDGGVRDRCGSRVLESGIMLFLLRAEDRYPAARRSIAGYLPARGRPVSGAGRCRARRAGEGPDRRGAQGSAEQRGLGVGVP